MAFNLSTFYNDLPRLEEMFNKASHAPFTSIDVRLPNKGEPVRGNLTVKRTIQKIIDRGFPHPNYEDESKWIIIIIVGFASSGNSDSEYGWFYNADKTKIECRTVYKPNRYIFKIGVDKKLYGFSSNNVEYLNQPLSKWMYIIKKWIKTIPKIQIEMIENFILKYKDNFHRSLWEPGTGKKFLEAKESFESNI